MARALDWLTRIACAGGLSVSVAVGAAAEAGDTARAEYAKASAALNKEDFNAFRTGLKRTEGYLLHPFLVYRFMRRRLAEFDPVVIRTFIERNQTAVISAQLRTEWLRYLGRNGQWQMFLDNYRGAAGDAELQCLEAQARVHRQGISRDNEPLLDRLWLSGASRPEACDAVFAAWERHGGLTEERVWARIRLAMASSNPQLAQWLGRRYLPAAHQPRVQTWLSVHGNPAAVLAGDDIDPRQPHAVDLVSHGVRRLARTNLAQAAASVARFRRLGVLDPDTGQVLMKDIAIAAAKQRAPDALKWMAEIPTGVHDDTSRAWQAEAALIDRDWQTLAAAVAGMSAAVQQEPKWRYWRALSLLETGDRTTGDTMLADLAQTRHYYGFMAADRLRRPYAMGDRPTDADPNVLAGIATLPGLRMAQELRAVGDQLMARRQWRWATRAFSDAQLRAASVLAHRGDWYDRAILDAARSGHREDLTIRFPVVHRPLVERYGQVFGVDSSLIFSVIRQESAFMVEAVSSAGALGLMQLMPGTGKRVARGLKRNINTRSAILEVENNIQLGSRYLRQMLDKFGNNVALAAAAYNAGPHRAGKWIPGHPTPMDVWIETIPFNETRSYVKNVLAFMMVYDYRLGRPARRMTSVMGSLPGSAAFAISD